MEVGDLVEFLRNAGFQNISESTAPVFKNRKLGFCFSADQELQEITQKWLIGFEDNFPLSLPQYYLVDNSIGFIPHVEQDGKICYYQDDYLYIDADRPADVIKETFELAKETVLKGLREENAVDFVNEFQSYWLRLPNVESIYSNIAFSEDVSQIKIGIKNNIKIALTDEEGYLSSVSRFIKIGDKTGVTFQNAIYIPLDPKGLLLPPKYNTFLSLNDVKKLVFDHINQNAYRSLTKLLQKPCKQEEYVLLSFIQPNGVRAFFGIRFSKNPDTRQHPLLSDQFKGTILPVNVERLDKEYIYKRSGPGTDSNSKKGLVIGCGSIGGFIAEDLVRSGFFNLDLVDGEIISKDNCYRHLTGFLYVGSNKARAVKAKLDSYFPHCTITTYEENIERLISKGKITFDTYDYIVVATGNVTVNSYLNKLFKTTHPQKPIFYVWNDPYGIGGHCIVTNISGKGCYGCLYANTDTVNTASFAGKIQPKPFLKTLSGCGSFYTPYSSLDSTRSSMLAMKMILDYFNGTLTLNSIYSWKGDASNFLSEGFILSPRYELSEQALLERSTHFYSPECKICKS
jgi:molybdopterin/thiamine biosynthesis adenylyltransferase